MKLYFHPGTNMAQAMAETVGYVNRARAFMPPGTVGPFIMRFDTGSVPVGYLVLSSETRSIGEIQDQALFKVRPMFASLPGVSAPPPFGGNQRTIVVNVDPDRLRGLQPVARRRGDGAGHRQHHQPSGNVRIEDQMPIVPVNAMVKDPKELGDIPIRPGADVLPARPRHHRGRRRHPHRLRPRQWQAGRLHPGHQAGRRLDPGGGQRGPSEPADGCGRPFPTTSTSASSSTNRPTSPGHVGRRHRRAARRRS